MAGETLDGTGMAGFAFGAVAAGLKKRGGLDLALIAAARDVAVAGVFTRNLVRAAPVLLSEARVRAGVARALLVNSGNANACTGEAGLAAARATTRAVAAALGAEEERVLAASTGVIGQLLDAERVTAHIPALVASLVGDCGGFANAILTTDRSPKLTRASAGAARVLGIAKGAGMIHPDVGPPQATMLAFLLTDAVVEPRVLQRLLEHAADESFNRHTVDGDTSTNDSVYALASGASGASPSEAELSAALISVGNALALQMVADGEGAEHVAEIVVSGLRTAAEARQIANTVARSLLVKTALHGKDANWGRLLAAAGRAGVPFAPDQAELAIGGVRIVANGQTLGAEAEAAASLQMRAPRYEIVLTLGNGSGRASVVTCDLGHGYVDVNASYRS